MIARLKEFYKTWLEPEGVRRWRTRAPQPDSQKFWTGTPVAAPPRETGYFSAASLSAVTLTRRDDSRACAEVRARASLPLPGARAGDLVQVAVTADAWRADSSLRIRCGASGVRHVALRPGHWLDVRCEVPAATATLDIETDQPVWVSYPRVVTRAARSDRPRHVLVFVMDGLSRRVMADRHPTDAGRATMPNLDRFFRDGLHLPNGVAASDWTLPTTASFFSGLCASRHGMVHPTRYMQHRTDRKLLAEYFQEAGFHTLALSTGNRLTPAFGSHRGFDRFIYHWPYEGRTAYDYEPARWIDEIHGHLDLHRADSTFTYAHFPDSHPAWNLPPLTRAFNLGRRGDSTGHDLDRLERSPLGDHQGRQLLLLRLYELDRAMGGLLRYIDEELGDDAVVVLTADHGTPWPDYLATEPKDRPSLNEFRIGTFLRLRARGVRAERRDALHSPNLDLMPTLLGLMGIALPPDLDGRDLLTGGAERPYIVSESVYRSVYEVAVTGAGRQWIEKYPLDELTTRITGDAVYRRGFPTGINDYSVAGVHSDPEYEDVVRRHIERVGLRASA